MLSPDLEQLFHRMSQSADRYLGYPASRDFDYSELERFLKLPINNCGDPFVESPYGVQTHEIERKVISFFASLYGLPQDDRWGYVTHGGSESNLCALFLARQVMPDAVVYFSAASHNSVHKAVRLLQMYHCIVPIHVGGEMNYDDLRACIKDHPGRPAVVVANIGTTMTGAVDQVEEIRAICRKETPAYFIHADAALAGLILPFLHHAPRFDFTAGADSVAVSGHKFFGMPFPASAFVTKKQHVQRMTHAEYIGLDTTISGSRNGLAPLFFWQAIRAATRTEFASVQRCLQLAQAVVIDCRKFGWPADCYHYSTTVVIRRPSHELCRKWQLAVSDGIAHVIVMPHTSEAQLAAFVDDLRTEAKAHVR